MIKTYLEHGYDVIFYYIVGTKDIETIKQEVKEYEIPDDQDTPEEIIINMDIRERLGKYIGLLPDSQREVILLKYYHNKKDKEIAEILNIDESAVSSRLNRAKAKLREMIGGGADEQDFKNR